jgi:glutathione S-transferase
MPFSIIVPDAYAYVLGVATSTSLVNLYLSANVALSRKPAGISYPTMYATEEQVAKNPAAYKFNCAQRAHGNFLENQSSFLIGLLVAGLRWPVVAAGLGAGYVVFRILYGIGYVSKGPNGRYPWATLGSLSHYTLTIMAITNVVKYIL